MSAIDDEAERENQRRAQMYVEIQSWKVVGRADSPAARRRFISWNHERIWWRNARQMLRRYKLARRRIIGNHGWGGLFRNTELRDSQVYRAADLAHRSSIPFAPVDQPKK